VTIKLFLRNRYHFVLSLFGVFWLSAIAAFAYLATYDLTPGNQGVLPLSWPAASQIVPVKNKFNAIVFLHPRCSCSLATANELAKIMTRAGDSLQVQVVVRPTVCPAGLDENSTISANVYPSSIDSTRSGMSAQLSAADKNSLLIKEVDSIPGVTRTTDASGREAKLFGAETSGDVLLYGATGELLYAGGITASRGHEGDNSGAEAMLKAIKGSRRATVSTTPVFGCSLEGM